MGKVSGKLLLSALLDIGSYENNRKSQKKERKFNTTHLAFPPTPLMFVYSSWKRGLSKHTHAQRHTSGLKEAEDGEVTTAVIWSSARRTVETVNDAQPSADCQYSFLISVDKHHLLLFGDTVLQMDSTSPQTRNRISMSVTVLSSL